MRSLESFIECNGQWEKAARQLYCHRHTLRYRIRRVEELTGRSLDSGATAIAYETVEDSRGRLPLLAPMSEVAGKIATQAGAFMLEKPLGGRGLLLGGVPAPLAREEREQLCELLARVFGFDRAARQGVRHGVGGELVPEVPHGGHVGQDAHPGRPIPFSRSLPRLR